MHPVIRRFCENYANLYSGAKHLEKGLNREWWKFWCLIYLFFDRSSCKEVLKAFVINTLHSKQYQTKLIF